MLGRWWCLLAFGENLFVCVRRCLFVRGVILNRLCWRSVHPSLRIRSSVELHFWMAYRIFGELF